MTPNHSAREQQSPLLKPGLTQKTRFFTLKPMFVEELASEPASEIWVRLGHPENARRGTEGRRELPKPPRLDPVRSPVWLQLGALQGSVRKGSLMGSQGVFINFSGHGELP